MSIPMKDLAVADPLAREEVTIVIRVLSDNAQRPARTALVSVGTPGQPPTFASGSLADVDGLIRQAWLAYGVRAELRQVAVADVGAATPETVAEEAVDDDANEDDGDERSAPVPAQAEPQVPPVQPRPRNLSLF